MKIGSLSEYLEALQAVESYYSSHTCEELMEVFKSIFPLGTPVFDVDENYLGDVISWEIDRRAFILHLEYNNKERGYIQRGFIKVKRIERMLSIQGIPITRVDYGGICYGLSIIKPED